MPLASARAPARKVVSFRDVVEMFNLSRPDGFRVRSADDASDAVSNITRALDEVELSNEDYARLVRWRRGWKAIEWRYDTEFGSASDGRKGPSAQALARKAQKREMSRQQRNSMRGGAGGGKKSKG